MKLIKGTLLLFNICLATITNAQNQLQPLLNVPTPQAASIGLFSQTPVDHSTGVPDINIPIYTIKLDNIAVPISCKYHLASVKPDAPMGLLGLGWSLHSGGCITRNVNLVPDELILEGEWNIVEGYYNHAEEVCDIDERNFDKKMDKVQIQKQVCELSSDEFVFNFCGYSGTFYYGGNNQWIVKSDQDIKVEFDERTGFISDDELHPNRINMTNWRMRRQTKRYFNKFKVTTPDGTVYHFGGDNATEFSIDYYNRNKSKLISTSWFLKKITTKSNHTIDFEYTAGQPNCTLRYSPWMVYNEKRKETYSVLWGTKCASGFLLFPTYLSKISTPNETITYDYIEDVTYKRRIPDNYLEPKSYKLKQESLYSTATEDEILRPYLVFLGLTSEDSNDIHSIRKALVWKNISSVAIKRFSSKNSEEENTLSTFRFDYTKSGIGPKKLKRIRQENSQAVDQAYYSFEYNTSTDSGCKHFHDEVCKNTTDYWGYWNSNDERALHSREEFKEE